MAYTFTGNITATASGTDHAVNATGGASAYGVNATNAAGTSFAIYALSSGASAVAIRGDATGSGSNGLVGTATAANGYALYASHSNSTANAIIGIGLSGNTASGGVLGYGAYGVIGNATSTGATNGAGITGIQNLGTFAGYFSGPVKVTGLLTKAGGGFLIDHPLEPEMKFL
jgi:hypothetical protein